MKNYVYVKVPYVKLKALWKKMDEKNRELRQKMNNEEEKK